MSGLREGVQHQFWVTAFTQKVIYITIKHSIYLVWVCNVQYIICMYCISHLFIEVRRYLHLASLHILFTLNFIPTLNFFLVPLYIFYIYNCVSKL